MRRIAIVLGAVLSFGAGLALAGCGGGGGSDNAGATTSNAASGSAPQQTVKISEKEFSLSPSAVNVGRPGTVAFQVTNNGQIAHALEIEGNGVEQETETIEPGESATISVQLSKAGSYEMYCPIDGHEDKGMKGSIRVAGSSGAGADTRGTTTDDDMTSTGDTSTSKGPGY
jgi:uncharacterized cupredoxin-like copper-binding protein